MVQAFTNGPVQMEPKPGGKFVLFGGTVEGKFLEMVRKKKKIYEVKHYYYKMLLKKVIKIKLLKLKQN